MTALRSREIGRVAHSMGYWPVVVNAPIFRKASPVLRATKSLFLGVSRAKAAEVSPNRQPAVHVRRCGSQFVQLRTWGGGEPGRCESLNSPPVRGGWWCQLRVRQELGHRPSQTLLGRFAKGLGTLFAGTHRAQVVVAVDTGGVPVVENDLDGVIPHLRGGIGAGHWFVHRQQRRSRKIEGGRLLFFSALVVTHGTRALIAQIRKIEMAGVAIGPSDIHAGPGFHMDFHRRGFFALVEWCRHGAEIFRSQFSAGPQIREIGGCCAEHLATVCGANRSNRREEWDFRGDKLWDGPESCRYAGRVPG